MAAQTRGSEIKAKGGESVIPSQLSLVIKKQDPLTKRTVYSLQDAGNRILTGIYGSTHILRSRNRLIFTIYRLISSESIVNIGVDANSTRLIALEVSQEKFVQLF